MAGLGLGGGDPGRPRVVGAMIGSLDGRATVDGHAGGLGSPADRALLRALRGGADAMLVGRNTLTTERYATVLDPEQSAQRRAAGRPGQPIVATLSRDPRSLADVPLLAEPDARVVVYTDGDDDDLAGAEICRLDPLDPVGLIADLHGRLGARLIVCEGGPHLLRDLAALGCLDDLVLTLAPLLVAGDGPSILTGEGLAEPLVLRLAALGRAGDHLMAHYTR